MNINVTFPGGVAVEATVKNHVVHTDQPEPIGTDSAPSPFDLFLASLATCAGFYALRFCQERSIATEGLGVTLETIRAVAGGPVTMFEIYLQLPHDFPMKYADAIRRAVDHCAVKRTITTPPEFRLHVVESEAAALA